MTRAALPITLAALALGAGAATAAEPARVIGPPVVVAADPQARVEAFRAQLARERRADRIEDARFRRALRAERRREASGPTYRTAMQLASVVYGVPVRGLSALTWCESRHTPSARNPTALSGSNATGAAQILYHPSGRRSSTWHSTPFRHLNPYDVTTNLLAAGYIWRRAGGSFTEWADVCSGIGDRA